MINFSYGIHVMVHCLEQFIVLMELHLALQCENGMISRTKLSLTVMSIIWYSVCLLNLLFSLFNVRYQKRHSQLLSNWQVLWPMMEMLLLLRIHQCQTSFLWMVQNGWTCLWEKWLVLLVLKMPEPVRQGCWRFWRDLSVRMLLKMQLRVYRRYLSVLYYLDFLFLDTMICWMLHY